MSAPLPHELVTVSRAARALGIRDSDARRLLYERGLVTDVAGRHRVVWGQVLAALAAPAKGGTAAPALQARWRALVEEAVLRHPAPSRVLGAAAVVAADPHDKPVRSKRSPAPMVHFRTAGRLQPVDQPLTSAALRGVRIGGATRARPSAGTK